MIFTYQANAHISQLCQLLNYYFSSKPILLYFALWCRLWDSENHISPLPAGSLLGSTSWVPGRLSLPLLFAVLANVAFTPCTCTWCNGIWLSSPDFPELWDVSAHTVRHLHSEVWSRSLGSLFQSLNVPTQVGNIVSLAFPFPTNIQHHHSIRWVYIVHTMLSYIEFIECTIISMCMSVFRVHSTYYPI